VPGQQSGSVQYLLGFREPQSRRGQLVVNYRSWRPYILEKEKKRSSPHATRQGSLREHMKTCPYCAHNNMEGIFYCEECGQILVGERAAAVATQQLPTAAEEVMGRNAWGTARFGREASIILHIRDAAEPVVLQPAGETILGRADPTTESKVGLDLTPFGAREKGVSRLHAAIRRGEDTLTLVDLGSVNGTLLNGQRLIPNQPRVLRDGDEIRLGKLVCHVYFRYV